MPGEPPLKSKTGSVAKQIALATELPFLVVGGACAGGLVGYFLDHWLHTKPWLMIVFGAVGFGVAVRDMLRRLDKSDPDGSPKS
jgi:F0F1-type ATP synthase assembly protein I